MMQQYFRIKEENPDCLLMFRLGDFYEMFGDDAKIGSEIMDVALTSREYTKGKRIPMCGVPYHAVDYYLAKLISAGHKVAICDQVEDPRLAKGLVKREVTRIVTPGTVLEDSMLDSSVNNYLASISVSQKSIGLAFVEMSSGEFIVTELPNDGNYQNLMSEIARRTPREILLSEDLSGSALRARIEEMGYPLTFIPSFAFLEERAEPVLTRALRIPSLQSVGLDNRAVAASAAAAAVTYLEKTQKRPLGFLGKPRFVSLSNTMILDSSTIRNLELVESIRSRDRKGTLLETLDHTKTPMGRRLIRKWILEPLLEPNQINARLDAVAELVRSFEGRQRLTEALDRIRDIERLVTRIAYGSANARDLLSLQSSLDSIPEITECLRDFRCDTLGRLRSSMNDFPELRRLVSDAIKEDAPAVTREGKMIKPGFDKALDDLNSSVRESREWISSLEARERNRTGIKSLKVGYNKVFGYFIEVSKANLHLVPQDYVRKQTLVNCERFITPELEEKERFVLSAEEKIQAMEFEIFSRICSRIAAHADEMRATANAVGELDVLLSLATAATLYGYSRPVINDGNRISIKDGRHPVVERMMPGQYVPNDALLDDDKRRFIILTGPNMAGKSTFMRQTALIVLMAQMGSFVPAKSAEIGVVDRIFTRVGAFDDLVSGQSTFMVEMIEVANILNSATKKSLVLLDEMGRGTSTYDGLSIAWAVAEHISDKRKLGAKTIFATHYHQLTSLSDLVEGIVNQTMAVQEIGKEIVFLRKVIDGKSDRSYGIHVARLAGLPEDVLTRSEEVLAKIEEESVLEVKRSSHSVQMTLFGGVAEERIRRKLIDLDTSRLTPEEASKKLAELKRIAKGAGDGQD